MDAAAVAAGRAAVNGHMDSVGAVEAARKAATPLGAPAGGVSGLVGFSLKRMMALGSFSCWPKCLTLLNMLNLWRMSR